MERNVCLILLLHQPLPSLFWRLAGTRMKSSTPNVYELCGRSMLSHAVHAAAGVSPTHIVVVTGHQRERVQQAVADVAAALDVAPY